MVDAKTMTMQQVLERLNRHLEALQAFTPTLSMHAKLTEELVLPLTIRDEDDFVLTRRDGQPGYREFQIEALYNSLETFGKYVEVALNASHACVLERSGRDGKAMGEWIALKQATYEALAIISQRALNAREQNSDIAKAYKRLKGLVDLALEELPDLILQVQKLAQNPGSDTTFGTDNSSATKKLVENLKEQLRIQQLKTPPMVEAEILELRQQLDTAKVQLGKFHKMRADIHAVDNRTEEEKGIQHFRDIARITELEQMIAKLEKDNAKLEQRQEANSKKATSRECKMAFRELDDVRYNQLIPAVMDDTRTSFLLRWQQLCDRIATWAQVGYHYAPEAELVTIEDFMTMTLSDDNLMCIYARDISVRNAAFVELYNSSSRHLVIQGLVHRILHEEVFEGVKKFLKFELSEPTVSWMDKPQPVLGWTGGMRRLYQGSNREPKSWKTRKWEVLTAKNLGDTNTATFDPLSYSEIDLQTKEQLMANSAEEREKKKALRYDIFTDMDTRFQHSFDLKAFHLNRARMMKTIFQLVEDPMRPDMLRWRTSVVRLIFDTVEHARIAHDKLIRRSALKYELWNIVKDALNLAISMQCQRKCWYTRMKPPVDDYQFEGRAMVDVREEPWLGDDPEIVAILERAKEINHIPWELFSIGKVQLTVTPALFVRGDDDDYSAGSEIMVAPAGVVPRIGDIQQMRAWVREQDMVDKEDRVQKSKSLVKMLNEDRERMEREGAKTKEWNPYHDLRDDDDMTGPTDLIPLGMGKACETKEGRLKWGEKEKAEAQKARKRAKERGREVMNELLAEHGEEERRRRQKRQKPSVPFQYERTIEEREEEEERILLKERDNEKDRDHKSPWLPVDLGDEYDFTKKPEDE